jgi:hypothetical protein
MPTETTLKKYSQAIKRITDAGVDINTGVLEWLDKIGVGESAAKTYLSAVKHHMGDRFPKEYQEYMFSLLHRQNERDEKQIVPEKFKVSFGQLVEVRQRLETQAPSVELVVASLVTLQPPLRNDYREMRVFTRANKHRHEGNELIWTSSSPRFILREYKTKGTYGEIVIPVEKPLIPVLRAWFDHLGGVPEYLLGRTYSATGYIELLQRTFKSVGKSISINATRHAYITHHLPSIATNTKKKLELAKKMLHSTARQEAYFVHDESDTD